jgi:multidrug efflux system outer membrane protein
MMNKTIQRIAPLLAALLLVACASAPDLKPPHVDMPSSFKEVQAADGSTWKPARIAEAQPRGQWWLAFNDKALDALVQEATQANANLAMAAARVKQARAIAGIAEADRIPQIGVGVGVQRGGGSNQAVSNNWQSRLTASYEVDLFGRVANNASAGQLDAAAAEATYRSVLLSLQADVAQAYFRLRGLDAELTTLNQTASLREQGVKVNQRRYELGDIGEFDLARARTELATARAEAIGLQRQRAQQEHALAVLLGKPAAMFTAAASPIGDAKLLPAIPAGLPSTLLERRPDVAAAERAMAASNARIGVARSAMFPALTISANGGRDSSVLSDVFNWSTRSWVLGALMSMPLLDGGRNKANIARSEAVLEESVASYRQQVLQAFADVEDQLSGLRVLAGQAEQTEAALVAARRSADLAQKLYEAGRSSYLDLLDAQRNLANVERSAVQLRGNQAVTTVGLVRALGGGWN